MSAWLWSRKDEQKGVSTLAELVSMARTGQLKPEDRVRPEGDDHWRAADEIPELRHALMRGGPCGGLARCVLGGALGLLVLLSVLAVTMWSYSEVDTEEQRYFQISVAASAPLRVRPAQGAEFSGRVEPGELLTLLATRGDHLRVRADSGAEGWITQDQVAPSLRGGEQLQRAELDPLLHPDRYVTVAHASWMALQDPQGKRAIFEFSLTNQAPLPMTDLVLRATMKDSRGNELERVELEIEGEIPAKSSTPVGTLDDAERPGQVRRLTRHSFDQLAATDPDIALRYREGIEVELEHRDFVEATVEIVELRALP